MRMTSRIFSCARTGPALCRIVMKGQSAATGIVFWFMSQQPLVPQARRAGRIDPGRRMIR
jgi:hypothetical protein